MNKFMLPVVLSIFLFILRFNVSYLAFHNFAEYFSVFVSLGVTLVSYYTYSFTKNRYLLFIGLGYFWVAILDILHTQTYVGENIYHITSANTTLTFWVFTRILEASILLIAPFMRNKNFSIEKTTLAFGFVTLLIATVAMNAPLALFIKGEGLTPLKIFFEYLVIFILLVSFYINKKRKAEFRENVNAAITLSILLTILSELSFMLYTDVYGIMNVVGHILKFLSFWIILQAIIKVSLSNPYALMQKGASTYNAIPLPAIVIDAHGIIKQVNMAACDFLSKDEDTILNQSNHKLFHQSDTHKNECPICKAIEEKNYLKDYVYKNTLTHTYTEFTLSPVYTKENNLIGIVQVTKDITEKRKLQNDIIYQHQLLQDIVNTVPVRIFWKDLDGVYLGANNLFLNAANLSSQEEIIGKNDFDMPWADTDAKKYRDDDLAVMTSDVPKLQFEESQTDEYGKTIILSTSKVPLKNRDGEIIGIVGTYEDITTQHQLKEELQIQTKILEHQATHDMLTKLPNRILFHDRLNRAIQRAKRNSTEFALLFIDLDKFKEINDSLGHHIGDDVLKMIAQRLKTTIREEDTLARLGGDEFTIIIEKYKSIDAISSLAKKIIAVVSKELDIKKHKLFVTSSIGISLYPKNSTNADTLLKYADRAMYKAKEAGRDNFKYY